MEVIYISNWANSQEISKTQLFLIDNFVRTTKHYSPSTEIRFMLDQITLDSVSQYVKDNTVMMLVMDQFNYHTQNEWPIVKMKAIKLIDHDYVFHMDYDIVWKRSYTEILNVFNNSDADVIYQKPELVTQVKIYADFLREKPEFKTLLKSSGYGRRPAYNAGITFLKDKNNLQFIDTNFTSNDAMHYVCWEQLVTPINFYGNNLKIDSLVNLITNFNLDSNQPKFRNNYFTPLKYDRLTKDSIFIPNLGLYHFLSDLKRNEFCPEFVIQISGIEYPENYLEQFFPPVIEEPTE